MNHMDWMNHRGRADHDPRKNLTWTWTSTVRDTGGRQPMIELQRRFSAAVEVMNQAWAVYRVAREDREAFHAYIRATNRCQKLKETMFSYMAGRRERRVA